jgi:hypothetical protein
MRDDSFEDDETSDQAPMLQGGEAPFGMREPQPYIPREAQPFPQNPYQQPVPRQQQQPPQQAGQEGGDVDRLPSFITGGQPQNFGGPPQSSQQNGHDGGSADRFPLHRRRRRHRGPRPDYQGGGRPGDDPTPQD